MAILNPWGGDDDPTLGGTDRILHRARKRFQRTKKFWDTTFQRSLEDTKFANADDRNHWQWPDQIYADRDGRRKPCLTINKTQVHNDLVINESMDNKASVRIRPTGNGATLVAATAYQDLIERIEYISTASVLYRRMIKQQVDGGISWLTLHTRYVDDGFSQEIYLKGYEDPTCVMIDPDAVKGADESGAMFGFELEQIQRDEFNRRYPRYKDRIGQSTLGADQLWMTDDYVLVAMYYEREMRNDELIEFTTADGTSFTGRRSHMERSSSKEMVDRIIDQIDRGEIEGRYRDVVDYDVNWYHIGGDCIMKKGDTPSTRWVGKYIPLIPLYGKRTFIAGIFDCKGHTRALISPQQILNYNASGQVQFGALQTRTQWLVAAGSIEANDQAWATQNIDDRAALTYNAFLEGEGEDGGARELPAPQRIDPPTVSPVYMEGAINAERWMMMVSGQYEQQFGTQNQQSASSGKAISARQRQGDRATYHFTEAQYDMYRYLGRQLIDAIPKVYDRKQILQVEGEDGNVRKIIRIDPDMKEAAKEIATAKDAADEIILNPSVGQYEVVSDPGPNYATKRQQAWDAFVSVLQQNMELVATIGDLLFKYGDFPGANDLMERMRRDIQHNKPWLFEDGPSPMVGALQAELQKQQSVNVELMQKLAEMRLEIKGKGALRDVEAFNADTKRLEAEIKAVKELVLAPGVREQMQADITLKTHQTSLDMIRAEHAAQLPDPSGQES